MMSVRCNINPGEMCECTVHA